MKKILFSTIGMGLFTTVLLAYGNNQDNNHMMQDKKVQVQNDHMGDHMHNGQMMNHSNPNGMTSTQMKTIKDKNQKSTNNHMGDHMHDGKMVNHSNPNGMTNAQINMKKEITQENRHMMGH